MISPDSTMARASIPSSVPESRSGTITSLGDVDETGEIAGVGGRERRVSETFRAPRVEMCVAVVYTPSVRSHDWIDRRSAALHDAVATKIEANPEFLAIARANLSRWLSTNPSQALLEWQHVLEHSSLAQLIELLRSPSPRAVRLRQSSPFAGVLTREEREVILRCYDPRRP